MCYYVARREEGRKEDMRIQWEMRTINRDRERGRRKKGEEN
jgi:hypothetical protein